MLRRVALVRTDISEELSATFIRVTIIDELGTKPILISRMKEALSSSETSVLTRATQRNIPEDTILHSHRRENLKSYILWLSNPCKFQRIDKSRRFLFPRKYHVNITWGFNDGQGSPFSFLYIVDTDIGSTQPPTPWRQTLTTHLEILPKLRFVEIYLHPKMWRLEYTRL
jgi:hypothetical protein